MKNGVKDLTFLVIGPDRHCSCRKGKGRRKAERYVSATLLVELL